MTANTTPIFPLTPLVGIVSLTSPTPVTSRANITGTTGLTQLTSTSTNGKRIDRIAVKAKGSTVSATLFIWMYNGTTSYLYDEITLVPITASNTQSSDFEYKDYINLILPPNYQLFVSTTIQQDINVFAHKGDY
jgi:hypothetical protein